MSIHYMSFTLKQQGEVLKKFVHQSLNKPLQIGFQRFISQNSVKVDFGPTFPSLSSLFSLSVLSQVWYPPRSKVQGAFLLHVILFNSRWKQAHPRMSKRMSWFNYPCIFLNTMSFFSLKTLLAGVKLWRVDQQKSQISFHTLWSFRENLQKV